MPVVKPPIHYRFRSAITGRWVRISTWKRWPRLTIAEQIVTPHETTDDPP